MKKAINTAAIEGYILSTYYMRRSGFEPEFRRWQRLVITATLSARCCTKHHLQLPPSLKTLRAEKRHGYVSDRFAHPLSTMSQTIIMVSSIA